MTSLRLPRWLGLLLRRWFPRPASAYRRPAVRSAKPMLTLLEERFSPTSLNGAAPIAIGSSFRPATERELSSATFGEARPTEESPGLSLMDRLALVSSPPAATDEPSVSTQPLVSDQEMFTPSIFNRQDTTARDALFAQLSSRPVSPLSTPPKPLPTPAANMANGGGRGVGGVSTPNAGGGGGGATGAGGGGPGLINANMFMGDTLGMGGNVLAANAVPSTLAAAYTQASRAIESATAVHGQASSPTTAFQTTYSMTAPVHPALPPQAQAAHGQGDGHGNGYGHGHGGSSDPLYVLDMNSGETIPAHVTLNTFSTWSENLLAQVSGGSVMSVMWNTSQAPDLTNISGQNTLNLKGTWSSFTGAARTDTISVTEMPQSGSSITMTMSFAVAGTDSPAYSSSRPTTSSTWPTVITPDQLQSGQPTQAAGPYASLGEADGSVQTSFAMPSYNPNTTPVSLDYNSTTANPQPIFLTEYQLPFGQTMPSTITAQLTFDGTALNTVTYSTSGMNPGDIVQIALQANATGLSTGRYPWSITVTNGSTPTTYSGNVDIVNQSSSPYGAGWSLDNVEQLVSVSGGMMLVNPDGTSLFFAGSGGTYTSPADDFSTLVKNQDGSYTRTLTDGTKINFNSSGQETSTVDRDGNTTTFGYSNNLLTTITDMNGQVTTLAYSSGLLTSITDPASHAATLAYSGSQLTSITDPGSNVWQYAYDSGNDLTKLTDPNSNTTTFTYNFADRVSSVTQADGSTEQLTVEQMNGLAAPGTGTSGNPAASVLLATGDQAQFTDANSNVWTDGLDWLGFGVNTAAIDPLGDAALSYVNANGLVWLSADALGRRTIDFFDSKGNVTKEVAPDDSTQQYQYNSFSEVTQYTNQNNNVTSDSYNSKGDLTQETDALNHVTSYAYNSAGLLTSTTDPNSNTTTYAYNSLNELTSTTDALNHVTTYGYDSAGNQTKVTDALGNVTTYSYNALGWLTSKTLPDTPGVFSTYTYSYDKVGNQTSVTDPNNHTTTYGYNALNEQTSATDPLSHATTYGYDKVGNQTSVTDALGNATTYGYDAANQQTSMTDPLGKSTTYGYDAAGEQTTITDPLGNVTQYSYNSVGRVASETVSDSFGTKVEELSYNYDPAGNLLSTATVNYNISAGSISGGGNGSGSGGYTATLGGSLSGSFSGTFSGNVVNSMGGVIGTDTGTVNGTLRGSVSNSGAVNGAVAGSGTVSLAGGLSGSGLFSLSGSLSGNISGGSGNVIVFPGISLSGSVSNSGNVSGTIGGMFSVTLSSTNGSAYAPVSNSGTFSGTAGETTSTSYNPMNQPTSVTDPLGNTTTYSYDNNGNVTTITDPNGNTTTYTYNGLGQTVSVTNQTCGCAGMNGTTTYGYNAIGQQTSVTDPLNNVTSYSYNARGNLLSQSAANGGVTSFAYDLAGNQTSETDPAGNTTTYAYNAANELTSTTNPQGHASTNAYNTAGWLTSTTDADGRTIDYAYNAAGQTTSETWVGGSYTATYNYNADGQLTSVSDPYSSYSYSYNALGQVTSVDNSGTPGVPTVTLSYTYDSQGNRTGLTDSLGGSISYTYNADKQMTGLGLSTNGMLDAQATFAYDGAGNLTGITRTAPSVSGSHTITTSYSYNHSNELTNIAYTDATASVTLASYTYGYNKAGILTSYQDNSGNSLTYGYDANNELTSATGTLAGSSYTFAYNYDRNGNRTSTSTDVNGTVTSATYSTGAGNELTSDGTYSYTYDNNGNTLTQTDIATGSVTYYTWDYKNRLTEVKQEDSHSTILNDEKFTYDVFGNRIGVSLNGTQQLYTVYDGSNPYMDFNSSGQLTERYLTNPNSLNQFYGQVSASGTTEWYLTDNLGSIRQVISASGSSPDAITYDPYGNIVSQTNSANAPRFQYTGGAYDSITGTYLDGAREDNPENGRWESQDPLKFGGGDSNLYRYVFNNPTELTDPTGLSSAAIPFNIFLNGLQADVNIKAPAREKIRDVAAKVFNVLRGGFRFIVTDQELVGPPREIASVNTTAEPLPKSKGELTVFGFGWSWEISATVTEVEIFNKAKPPFARYLMTVRLDITAQAGPFATKHLQAVFTPGRWFFIVAGGGKIQDGTVPPANAPACPCGCGNGATCACEFGRMKQ